LDQGFGAAGIRGDPESVHEFAIAPGLTTRRFVFPGDLAETDVEEALDRLASALSVAAELRRLSRTVLASH